MAKTRNRIYTRQQGGTTRYYGDFRDLGGKREALKVPGERRATTDPDLAETLAAHRVTHLKRNRAVAQGRTVVGLPPVTTFQAFAAEHLKAKATEVNPKTGQPITDQWLEGEELRLTRAAAFFGSDCDLSSIKVKDVEAWSAALAKDSLGGGTRRQHLNSLSNLLRRALSQELVATNPVAALTPAQRPQAQELEAKWLEVPEAALLLEAARTYKPKRDDLGMPFVYELLATPLLTGGRPSEVLGLAVDDISFERKAVTFRVHDWRRLKTLTSYRTVPLWPQLAAILKPWVAKRKLAGGRLLFPSLRTGEERMLTDARKLIDAVAGRVGFAPRELNLYDFRHTYCAARLQTLDNGEPVSTYTVGRELGHGGDALVRKVYAHIGTIRHRSEVVEYRVAPYLKVKHREKPVRDWVKALRVA